MLSLLYNQGIMDHLGSKVVGFFVVSIAVFAVHITEDFSLQIPPPFTRYKLSGYSLSFLHLSINTIICKESYYVLPNLVNC